MGFEKTCECCGKTFVTKRYPTKYCSQSCYRKMQRTAVNLRKMQFMKQYDSSLEVTCDDGKLRFRKFCAHCGKEFTGYKQTTMFCSSACAKRYRIGQEMTDRATKVTSRSVELELSRVTHRWADKDVFRVGEAAEYLGVNPKSIYRYVWKGYIKPIVLQRTILISKESLSEIFKEGAQFRNHTTRKSRELPEFKGTKGWNNSCLYHRAETDGRTGLLPISWVRL